MSNRLFQGVVHQMRDTIDRMIGVVDETAAIIACSDLSKIGTTSDYYAVDFSESHDVFVRDGYTYKPFGPHIKADYAVFVEGTDETAARYAQILAISLSTIKQYYDEKYDRNNFIKNGPVINLCTQIDKPFFQPGNGGKRFVGGSGSTGLLGSTVK